MEIARTPKCKILWNGKNITDDISSYISSITYTDKEEAASDELTLIVDDSLDLWSGDWTPEEGDTLQIYLGYSDALVDTGLFEVDELVYSGKPCQVEIKAIAAGITKALRSKNSKAFEKQTLKQIAQYFCNKHSLTLIDRTSSMLNKINIDRITQESKTDLFFLSELAAEYGFIFSVRGKKLIFTSYYELDNAASVGSIDRNQCSNYSITKRTAETYSAGKISQRDAKTGKTIAWKATDVLETNKTDIALFAGRVENKQQAEAKVKGQLWRKNKGKYSGNINDLPGDPSLLAGVNYDFTGFGTAVSGQYHITSSTHKMSGDSEYTTSIEIRKTGSVDKVKAVPKQEKESSSVYDANEYDFQETEEEDTKENS